MRRAARVDANHAQIVSALRAAGAVVHSLAAVGNGMPDLLVAFQNKTTLMEIKDGSKVKSAQKLTDAQVEFWRTWTGGPLSLVDGPEAALRALGVLA
jgi:hypothetical protein